MNSSYIVIFHVDGLVYGIFLKKNSFLVDMAPLYETLIANKVLDLDQKALDLMRSKIDDELKKIEEKSVMLFLELLGTSNIAIEL